MVYSIWAGINTAYYLFHLVSFGARRNMLKVHGNSQCRLHRTWTSKLKSEAILWTPRWYSIHHSFYKPPNRGSKIHLLSTPDRGTSSIQTMTTRGSREFNWTKTWGGKAEHGKGCRNSSRARVCPAALNWWICRLYWRNTQLDIPDINKPMLETPTLSSRRRT